MSAVHRLALAGSFDDEPPTRKIDTQGLVVVPWYDEHDTTMPYVYTLHLSGDGANRYVLENPVPGRVLTGITGFFMPSRSLSVQREHDIITFRWVEHERARTVQVNFHGASIVGLRPNDPAFRLVKSSEDNAVLVSKARNDNNRSLALRIEAILTDDTNPYHVLLDLRRPDVSRTNYQFTTPPIAP